MDRHELDRMFDALEPAPGRERELLRQLLQDGVRRKTPMKNWKRLAAACAAAALLVTGAAAATVPGLSQKLLAYLGVAPEDTQTAALLIPGAMAVDITTEDNGARFHVTQVLRDRTAIMVLADFTAPEGTELRTENPNSDVRGGNQAVFGGDYYFLDQDGEKIDLGIYSSYLYSWEILEDEDPLDNHLSMMFTVNLPQGGMLMGNAASMALPFTTVGYMDFDEDGDVRFVEAYSGDWSCEVPLPQKDIGWRLQVDEPVGELDGAKITVKELYLSPVNLLITLGREGGTAFSEGGADLDEEIRWLGLLDVKDFTLTDKDGNVVSMDAGIATGSGLIGDEESTHTFRLAEVTDPAQFLGGSLTLELSCGSVTIPLDQLAPVEP